MRSSLATTLKSLYSRFRTERYNSASKHQQTSRFTERKFTTQSKRKKRDHLSDEELESYLDQEIDRSECPLCCQRGHLDHNCLLCAGIGVIAIGRLCGEALVKELEAAVVFGIAPSWMSVGIYYLEHKRDVIVWLVTEERVVHMVDPVQLDRVWQGSLRAKKQHRTLIERVLSWLRKVWICTYIY